MEEGEPCFWGRKALNRLSNYMSKTGMRIRISFVKAVLYWRIWRLTEKNSGSALSRRKVIFGICQRKTDGRSETGSIV